MNNRMVAEQTSHALVRLRRELKQLIPAVEALTFPIRSYQEGLFALKGP